MLIRNARAEDFKRVRELLLSENMTTSEFFTEERFKRGLERFGRYHLVEERDGKVVGFISGFDDGGIFYGYMGRLVVDPGYRNQGIGESLTRACLKQFEEFGVPIVYAGIGLQNTASERLVQKLGCVDGGYKLIYFETKAK
ncbi:MAG: GNAT family N-acetyltransferase [Candidatus Aenigmarchaeota archaeon]|nr:GNAT family N-acetyltransferase [Candidatus Aenigmarchaeota archaeon]